MGENDDDSGGTKRVTFRIPQDQYEEFDRLVKLAQGLGVLDQSSSKSALLRQSVSEINTDLRERIEDEAGVEPGNSTPTATATTSD